ncbi:MAG: ATP-dependent DNA helicase RecG [Clostridia bacterium]|nr:ATP-dependent DNA helicase RecG [Clostridia bacterium]
MELSSIRGLGNTRLTSLRAMGIVSLRDLLFYLPVDYENMTVVTAIADAVIGNQVITGTVTAKPVLNRFNGMVRVTASVKDATGILPVIWYNQPWMAQQVTAGKSLLLYGRVAEKRGRLVMQNPECISEPSIRPRYKEIKGIPGKTLRGFIEAALEAANDEIAETLPERIRTEHALLPLVEALRQAHQPEDMDTLRLARRRFAFEQMLMYQAAIGMLKDRKPEGPRFSYEAACIEEFWKGLPFPPTNAQRRVLQEIAEDLKGPHAMSRLVQGDVGCGKTAIAFGSIKICLSAGYQAAMMAPTEILAQQHYVSAKQMLGEEAGVGLLIGSMKASEKKKAHQAIASGEWRVIIGTHALISENVTYQHLGLVITDEQHRFGVRQRSLLQEKGDAEGTMPHVLVMSATPIPRSLALILYGDLDVSIVDELPPGRTPVRTRIVPESKRSDMYGFLRNEIAAGRQAYVVCPLVEDSEVMEDVRSAQTMYADLAANDLKGLSVALTYGNQKAEEKQAVLDGFSRGEISVLVSTTVIEVGVNVPNATVMIIENAERFGLSQLHQLRGRVGRGSQTSWCFLLAKESAKLQILTQTNDGFLVAQKDLELRGPGELMGTRQSGQDIGGILMDGDIRLLDEAVQCMKNVRSNPAYAAEKACIEREAMVRYAAKVQQAALN